MNKFFQTLGRVGHIALQAGLLGAQGYAAYKNGSQVGAINYGIGILQVFLADQALKATPPVDNPAPQPPKV